MEYTYKEESINAVLQYLGTRPYAEVKPYIDILLTAGTPSGTPEVKSTEENVQAQETSSETPAQESTETTPENQEG